MKSEVHDVIQRVELAERIVVRLERLLNRSADLRLEADERAWLTVARARLEQRATLVREQLEASLSLPELKALRAERQLKLEQEWLVALRALFADLVREVGPTSPLIEALFPHQRFEKLERGGAAQRTYRAEFAPRRASTYVRRLAADPEYPFLTDLLTPVDRASEALQAFEAAQELSEDAAEPLRASLLEAGAALALTLRQARALSEAALLELPEQLAELAFDERPRKRSARPPSEQALE